jgi:hypothetical protein
LTLCILQLSPNPFIILLALKSHTAFVTRLISTDVPIWKFHVCQKPYTILHYIKHWWSGLKRFVMTACMIHKNDPIKRKWSHYKFKERNYYSWGVWIINIDWRPASIMSPNHFNCPANCYVSNSFSEKTNLFSNFLLCNWDHEISVIVTSILAVLTVFQRTLSLSSLLIMEIMAIHSWKSQYIHVSVWFWVMIYCVIC